MSAMSEPAPIHGDAAPTRLSSLGLALLSIAFSGLLAACASAPEKPAADSQITPNPNLVVQGIPPLPTRIATELAPYGEFRGHGFVDWHPTRREMLISHRPAGGNTAQLFQLAAPLAEPVQLTDAPEPVTSAAWEPRDGRFIVYARGSGGNEANQLYRLDPASRSSTLLTDPDERHSLQGWLHHSSTMLVTSVPLDKTASGGSRARISTRVRLVDPLNPAAAKLVAELDGGGWFGAVISRDDRQLALTRYLSANESQIWLIDLASGRSSQLLPAPGSSDKASHFAADFSPDGEALYLTSDRAGEFRELFRVELDSGRLQRITPHIPWDIGAVTLSADGRVLAAQANVDGRDELRLFDTASLRELPVPAVPAGNVGSSVFHRRLPELAFSLSNVRGPSQLYALNADSGRIEQWTRPVVPSQVDTSRFREQRIIRWQSFDGRTISGLINEPPQRFTGKRPVLILIHGGPEAQARFGFLGRYNHLVNDHGIVVIQPNVRGSSGYGKTFLTLDNGRLREDSVKDIGALLDWIARQPGLDASRVVVSGGSYGGYMSLAVAIHYADRIAGAIDVVGISNFVTFLTNTESYRRDLRRVEYGDERDPEMRAFLERISPLTNAERIRKPLFVVQGRNDPRVPYTEAEQIVERVRQLGVPVWYLRAENEGHGFARKENADFQFHATVEFLRRVIGAGSQR
ncbi:S9 family peptidase [Piscinibacter sakaiensis]|uniref:S9 family peptidase n=1 Tax=Piscinibacter sakaiensis TaxID=1547922 RepID=UPI003AAE9F01